MRNLSFLFFIFTTIAFAKEIVEVYAETVLAKGDTFVADGSVIVLYDGAMIKADKAVYDKNSSLLTLEGKVEMISLEENVLASDKLVINTQSKSVKIDKIFLGGEEDLWIDASGAEKNREEYRLFNSRISSCNKANPDWTIEFAEANYYKDRSFVTMKDAKLRFYDTTVFYFPFLALPTLNKRTTGILPPRFKLTQREGLLYEQPIFYAPQENWDIELNPQIRANRGAGAYITARFVDSNRSEGYFRTGYFKNSNDYSRSHGLNQEHWGAELFYKSTGFLSDTTYLKDYQRGFYLNSTYLNDREYLNLQKDSVSSLISSNLIESRLNSFIYNEDNYLGLYGRYNIDTSQEDNQRTIQNLPSLHYHHYMSQIMGSRVFYTIDGKLQNYTREKGSSATRSQIDIPITYYESFFDDFLDVSLSENLYLSRLDFRNLREEGEDYYYYYRNYHTLQFSSDLSKKMGSSVHTIHPSLTYIRPSIEHESPLKYRDLGEEKKEFFVSQTQEEQLSLALSQHYYNANLDTNFFHTFGYSSYPERVESRGDIHNKIGYEGEKLGLYTNLIYAWNEKQIRSLTSSLRYNQNNYDIMLTHFYNHDFLFDNKKTSFIDIELANYYNDKNSWFVNFDYDMEQSYNHQWKLGWVHQQKCWSARVSIGQEVVPNVDDSFRNTALYLELNLNPIGGIQQNIEDDFSSQGNK